MKNTVEFLSVILKGCWTLCVRVYQHINNSKIALGILGALLASVIVGSRDAYFQREELFRPQRTLLLNECDAFFDKIESPLVEMTQGYADFSVDVEDILGNRRGVYPLIPAIPIPADKEEEVKWKIRRNQEKIFKIIKDGGEQRRRILQLIQNYTVDPNIEIQWRLVDTALYLLKSEDRLISGLWMEHQNAQKDVSSIVKWNEYINTADGIADNDKFVKESPMAFRVYFYQNFIRKHMGELIRLILQEQAGVKTIIPPWLKLPQYRKIPAIRHPEIIDAIFSEHAAFRAEYGKKSWGDMGR